MGIYAADDVDKHKKSTETLVDLFEAKLFGC